MAKLNVIDLDGQGLGEIEVADEVFATEVKDHLLWEVVRWQRAKRRAGTAKTKNRWEIHATGAKMYKQKGTGNARHHSRRPNIFRGGGQVFGPQPRSYEFDVNKKIKASALRSALSLRAAAGNLLVVRDFTIPESKTKNLHAALLKLDASKALLVDADTNESLRRSARNLPNAQHLATEGINVYDILRFPKLLMSETSLRAIEARLNSHGRGSDLESHGAAGGEA